MKLIKILNGENQRIKQKEIDPVGSYFRIRKEGDEWINWEWTSRKYLISSEQLWEIRGLVQ